MKIFDLETPALLIDADALDQNLSTMAQSPTGVSHASTCQGAQVHRSRTASEGVWPPRIHVRNCEGGRRHGGGWAGR